MKLFQQKSKKTFLIALSLLILGALFLGRPVYHIGKRQWIYYQSQARWEQWKQENKCAKLGEPIAWLKAPEAKLDFLVLYGGSKENLSQLPSLSEQGARPDQKGVKVIQAHRDIHFNHLGKLKIGETIELASTQGEKKYRVVETEILSPEQADQVLLSPRSGDWLALNTCYPFRYIGPAPQRYIVWAVKI